MTEAKTKGWSFHGPCGTTNNDIIRWWESRRLHSNLYVGLTGFATWRQVLVVGGASVKPGKDFEETPSDDFRPNRLGDPPYHVLQVRLDLRRRHLARRSAKNAFPGRTYLLHHSHSFAGPAGSHRLFDHNPHGTKAGL